MDSNGFLKVGHYTAEVENRNSHFIMTQLFFAHAAVVWVLCMYYVFISTKNNIGKI